MKRLTVLVSVIGLLTILLICEGGTLPLAAGGLDKPASQQLWVAELRALHQRYVESLSLDQNLSRVALQTFSDGFENCPGPWVFDDDPSSPAGWGCTTYMAHAGSYSAWVGADRLNPASGYVDNMLTLMTTVVDLSAVSDATLEYYTYYSTEDGYDGGLALLTTDAITFGCAASHSGQSSGWERVVVDLTAVEDCDTLQPLDFTGEAAVVLSFGFYSDETVSGLPGLYIDDVLISSGSSGGDGSFYNMSTRGFVGTGGDVMIAGVIIQGGSKRVMFRALGPTLGEPPFNVPGALADPYLQVYDDGTPPTLVAECDNWQSCTGANLIPTGYEPPNPLEPALVLDLPEGNFTAIISGVGGGTGVAIVEGYDIP